MAGRETNEEIASKKILVVDKDEVGGILTEKFLEHTGIPKENIMFAKNGSEAVELAQKELFDIILMDTALPGMDGIEAAQRIRFNTSAESPFPKIVAYTTNTFITKKLQETALFDDIVLKPIKRQDFSAKILEILNIENSGN